MRWVIFAGTILLAFAAIGAFVICGASLWTSTLAIPVAAFFWLLRILFTPPTA